MGPEALVPSPRRAGREAYAAFLRFATGFFATFLATFFTGAFFFTALAIVISPSREVRIISNKKNMRYSNCFVDREMPFCLRFTLEYPPSVA